MANVFRWNKTKVSIKQNLMRLYFEVFTLGLKMDLFLNNTSVWQEVVCGADGSLHSEA